MSKRFLCSHNHRVQPEQSTPTPAHCKGIKPRSGALPRIRAVRLSDGDGEARRKAGLIECSESLSLLLLNMGQGAAKGCREQPAEGEGSGVGAAALGTSWFSGMVFGVPGGHKQ